MSNADIDDAMRFFAARLRGASRLTEAKLRRWTRHKLREDARATAELMLRVGYRATYIRYFVQYHIAHIDHTAGEEVRLVAADLRGAAQRLKQPYRDLAAVCFRWGYVHSTVVRLLERALKEGKEG